MTEKMQTGAFTLARTDEWMPHSNAVGFGIPTPDEPFPPLYTNVYNTYAKADDRREGCLCVYRLFQQENVSRCGEDYTATLVQVIRIGFTEDRDLWKSLDGNGDTRPYGNFCVDGQRGKLYAFVMRDKEHVTRYFTFDLPATTDGEEVDGVRYVTLGREDIRDTFDGPYMNYMQGACRDGVIVSVEGFGMTAPNLPALRVIDMTARKETRFVPLHEYGLTVEPEFADYWNDTLIYSDATGKLYRIEEL